MALLKESTNSTMEILNFEIEMEMNNNHLVQNQYFMKPSIFFSKLESILIDRVTWI